MDDSLTWLVSDWRSLGWTVVTVFVLFIVVTAGVRALGLRSFSKLSSTDFVTTVAMGSVLAAAITSPNPSMVIGATALLSLFALKGIIAALRRHTQWAPALLDNEPLCLMQGARVLDHNLALAKISRDELHSKLREANVFNYRQVVCVVLESTGDVSVLHKSVEDCPVQDEIFADVRGRPA